jgi:thioredoxin reductase
MNKAKVAVIGAGPAGIACAIQLSRYGIIPLLFERDMPGGLLKNAGLVENYPGFPGGISGTSLIRKMAKQLELANISVIPEKVINVLFQEDNFRINTEFNEFNSELLVIATGTVPVEWAGFPLPGRVKDKTFYEVFPLRNKRNSVIAIIGAGDAAFDYALQLAMYNKVLIFSRSDRVNCLPLLWTRAKSLEQVTCNTGHMLRKVLDESSSSCLKLFFQTQNGMKNYLADYLIFAVGRRPELSFADPSLKSKFDELQQEGKLYLAGDVKNELLRQASIATGDGIRAAMMIYFNESHKKNKQ